ncbi:MAG: hypothetical protein AB9903_22200 [Vulcanimicrobiota bacterium]
MDGIKDREEEALNQDQESVIIDGEGIDVWIDEPTPCLINRETNEIIHTEYPPIRDGQEMRKIESKFSRDAEIYKECYKRRERNFNWNDAWNSRENNSEFYKLTLVGQKEIQGLAHIKLHQGIVEGVLMESAPHNIGSRGVYKGVGGHLTAIGVKRSYEEGNGGYMFFTPKTELIKHYEKELKATIYQGEKMMIDGKAAKYLYEKYFGEKND